MKSISSILASILLLTLTASASDVLLRPSADTNATVIGRVPQSHKAFKSGTPVSDTSKANDGWHQTTVKSSYKGYVDAEELGKNFSVQPGTIVRVDESMQSPALTTCEESDRMFVTSFSQDHTWAQVRFTKAVTVFYKISEVPDTVAIDSPKPPRRPSLKSNKPAVKVMPDSLEPESAVWIAGGKPIDYTPPAPPVDPSAQESDASNSIMVESNTAPLNTALETSQDALIRNLIGTLQRERGSAPAIYPLRLYKDNKRIAYVDMSGIFISDLRPYLDKQVLIQGEIRSLSAGSSESVIHARSIQLSE